MLPSAKTCCAPNSPKGERLPLIVQESARRIPHHAVLIPASKKALLGTNVAGIPDDGETPIRKKNIKAFLIGATTVTNAEFAEFVQATGYVTEAEQFGWSFVFFSQVPKQLGKTEPVPGLEWWHKVDGASWKAVNGLANQGLEDHPVVHISWHDARAYADWVGGRLPTESQWEHAARGGLGNIRFPWGNEEPNEREDFRCNIWQGQFPEVNSCADGYATTAPAKSFTPNGYGLYNMVGNVWEWTADTYRVKSLKKHVKQRLSEQQGYKLSKGGSFLCHRSYCYRYRIAARSGNSPDSTATHHGLRVVWDPQ